MIEQCEKIVYGVVILYYTKGNNSRNLAKT